MLNRSLQELLMESYICGIAVAAQNYVNSNVIRLLLLFYHALFVVDNDLFFWFWF